MSRILDISIAAVLLTIAVGCSSPAEEPTEDVDVGDRSDAGVNDGEEAPLITGEMALELVDPFMGTAGHAFGYAALTPAAQVPYGLVRLGPDTSLGTSYPPFHHFSGYHFEDPDVRGFSHLHFIGTGVPDYGNIRVLPRRELGEVEPDRWFTAMDKDTETASPGFYSVHLPDEEVQVELTASEFGGLHRYSFDGDGEAFLTIDAAASVTSDDVLASGIEVDGSTVTGWATHSGAYTGRTRPFTVHFSMTVEPAADAAWIWADGAYDEEATEAEGESVGGVLRFDDLDGPVELRVGVSIVDLDAAEANRVAQLDGQSLEDVRESARTAWAEKLDRVRLRGADPVVERTFYTSLYNIYRMPTRFGGVDGRYRGLDGEVHEADDFTYYTDLSLWDTFRTLHPWLTLTDVDEQRNVLRSLSAMYEQGGYFPRWPAAISYTGGMLGSWADVLFAEAALKGIDGVDYADAYVGLKEVATTPSPAGADFGGRSGIQDYIDLGYIPVESGGHSVSRTLEYAWGDFAMANLAQYLELDDDESLFRERSTSFENVYHQESGFFRPRHEDGSFDLDDDPEEIYMNSGPFTEGNAWHWRFYALHDPDSLIDLFGGEDELAAAIDDFFSISDLGRDGEIDTTFPDSHYWHGNEPALHTAFLLHAVDDYDALSHWVRQIQTRLYTDGPPGNDDGGTMSGWYIFNAVGLYPVAGSDRYLTGIPLAPYAEITTDEGTLVVEAPGAAPRSQRVTSVTIDGAAVDGGELRHEKLLNGTLRFEIADGEGE